MRKIPGYNITEKLFESTTSIIYRAEKTEDQIPVILKVLQPASPEQKDLNSFQYEYEITGSLDFKGIPGFISMETLDNTLMIVEEDIAAESLEIILKSGRLTLKECLYVAIQIAVTVEYIHDSGVIHKNLNPSNVIWNKKTNQVQVIDFGIASHLFNENSSLKNSDQLEGTLAYLSPEETGRINSNVDYRTDLYSLGITIYEMLCGQLPFPETDAMRLVHSHIARKPAPAYEISSEIPQIVSDIVLKLLEKNVEDRYQSASGLKIDLEKCYNCLSNKKKIKKLQFELGQNDYSRKFHISRKLYGRDKEIKTILKAFKRVGSGKTEILLISGNSGVGKSALISDFNNRTFIGKAHFISGKFDQLSYTNPYSSIIQALQGLCRQILTENEVQINEWKVRINNALGPNGQLIVDMIPEIELIIGKQKSLIPIPPEETANRFNRTFLNFIQTFASMNFPLVFFLDDLQWADNASLNLIKLLSTNENLMNILIIGNYRENEVNQSHPLIIMLDQIKKEKGIVNIITIKPLNLRSTNSLIADSMRCSPKKTLQFSEFCYQNTNGNPFFLKQYILDLAEKNLIFFDKSKMNWTWDLKSIKETDCSDNVAKLITGKITRLPEPTRELLSYAACIGIQFDIGFLSIVFNKEESQVLQDILPAIESNVISPVAEDYVTHKFLHDQIQQTVISFIKPENLSSIHYKIGSFLLEKYNESELDKYLFVVTDQLNIGMNESIGEKERLKLAILNFNAGTKAKASIAYNAAKRYFSKAYELLPSDSWVNNYPLTLQYCLEKGELESLTSDWESAASTLEIAEKKAQNLLDQSTVSIYKASMYRMKNDLNESLNVALEALGKLDIKINAFPDDKEISDEISSFINLAKDFNEEELFNIPELTDPVRINAMSLLYECFAPAYLLGSPLVAIIGTVMSRITIKEGNCSYSSIGYIFLSAITFANSLKDFNNAYKFGNLAIKINDRIFHKKDFEACIFDMWGTFVCHHKDPIAVAKSDLMRGFVSGLENGSYQWGVYSGIIYVLMSLWGPGTLEDLTGAFEEVLPSSRKVEFHITQWGYAAKATAYNIIEEVNDRTAFSEKAWPELHSFIESRDISTMLIDTTIGSHISGWFSDTEKALEFADKGDQYLAGAPGVYFNTVFRFHQALAYTSAFDKIEQEKKAGYLEKIKSILADFELFAEHNAVTYLHQLLIIKAELQRIDGSIEEAMDLYDSAIDSAKEAGFLHNEAFACELAARCYFSLNKERIGNAYIYESYLSYSKWGATAKVSDLERSYPQILGKLKNIIINNRFDLIGESTKIAESDSNNLDMTSVMKASHILSGEIVLSELLKKIIHILIENAGATRGLLILENGGQWQIEAEGYIDVGNVTVLQALPIKESEKVPESIINYISRAKENVVLSEATEEGLFAKDKYIVNQRPKSVLAMPLINHGSLNGILYLENNLTTGTFTTERLQVIELLALQAGISLENARLFEEKKKNADELAKEISERMKTGDKLRESEEKHTLLFESMVSGVIYQDGSGIITDANQSAEKILGLTLDQMTGRSSIDPRWKTIHEDGSDFPGEGHPAMISLKTGKPVKEVIMGVYNPSEEKYNWISINSIPQFIPGEKKPYRVITTFDDVTERTKIEERLKSSSMSAEISMNAIVMSDLKGIITYANPAAASIWGYKNRDEIIGTSVLDYWSEDSKKEAEEIIEILLKEHSVPTSGELVGKKLDGTEFIVEFTAVILKDKNENYIGMTGSFTDITSRKHAEEKIRESEEKYSSLVSILASVVWTTDANGQFVEPQFMFEEFTGQPWEQHKGWGWAEMIHPDDREEIQMLWERAVRDRSTYFTCGRMKRANGTYGHLEAVATPIFNEYGEVKEWVGTITDITDRKKAELDLISSNEQLNLALSVSNLGLCDFNLVTQKLTWSDLTYKMFDKNKENFTPSFDLFNQMIHPEDVEIMNTSFNKVLEGDETPFHVAKIRIVNDTGREWIMEFFGKVTRNSNGEAISILGIVQDITEKLKIENAINRATKLESLGIMAGGIAHDFNNFLGGIYGYIELAKRSSTEDKVTDYLQKTVDTIDRARNLTGQLLTFAKGGTPVCKVEALFPFIKDTVQFALSGSNVMCNFDVQHDLKLCSFDKNQIGQVIDNLIINANQAMPLGGQIDLSARNISLKKSEHTLLEAGEYVKISIKDIGIGIPQKMLSSIFDPFFTTKPKGHGLGLATCYSIVKRHGGCIDVESEQGKGSIFHIFLPISIEVEIAGKVKSVRSFSGHGTFIVLDDEEIIRETTGAILEDVGFEVVCKENGQDMLDFLICELEEGREISGMIFDLTIPGAMGGKEAIKEVRKLNIDIPVFVSSGYAEDPVMANPTEYGFSASITKPFKISEFVEMVSEYMSFSEY